MAAVMAVMTACGQQTFPDHVINCLQTRSEKVCEATVQLEKKVE